MEIKAEYKIFDGNKLKLPHGELSWVVVDDPDHPGLQIMLDGDMVLWIEECVEDGHIQTHAYGVKTDDPESDEPVHTEVLRTWATPVP